MVGTDLLVGDEIAAVNAVNVRAEPAGAVVGRLIPGQVAVVVGGPRLRNDLVWWQLRNGVSGWAAQFAEGKAVLYDRADNSSFGRAMRFVLHEEGGEANDPNDRGGYTLWGISQNANSNIDVRALSLPRAKQIYRERYWNPAGCPELAWDMALVLFDMAVNAGVSRALSLYVPGETPAQYTQRRRTWYMGLEQFSLYGQAWLARTDRALAAAVAL